MCSIMNHCVEVKEVDAVVGGPRDGAFEFWMMEGVSSRQAELDIINNGEVIG